MRRSKFSGVYSFSTDWTENRRKNHYFVWELPDGAFAVQELNKAFQPLAEPERISARAFAKNFRAEPEILAMPVTTPDLSRLENREKSDVDKDSLQQAASAGAAPAKAPGSSPSHAQNQATAAQPDAATPAAAQAAPPNLAQSEPKGSPQAQPGGAPPAAREAGKSATAFANAGQGDATAGTGAASSSQPDDDSTSTAKKPGMQRVQTAQKASPPPHKLTVAGEGQRTALQKKGTPAQSGTLAQRAGVPTAEKKISAVEADKGARVPPQASSPAPGSQMTMEAIRKAKITESRLRETFRQTLLRLRRPRERQAALSALEQLAGATEDICTVHKHMFRDFGVRLRQNSQPALALLFTRKVVELAPNDDHAHFNLARILCMLGQFDEAAAHVRAAMSMASEEPTYFRMLVHIRKEKLQNRGQSGSSGR